MCHENWTGADPFHSATPIAVDVEDGARMPGWSFEPEGPSRGVCLVVPDIYGPSPFYAELSRMLADTGVTAILVDYFFREGSLPEVTREAAFERRAALDERRTLRDLSTAIDHLGARPGRTGVIGFCLAGQFALDLCAERDDLATVCFYAFPEGVQGDVAVPAPRPIDLADEITGPILAFWGTRDYIPLSVISRFEKAMRTAGVDYEQHLYEGAGHSFLQGLVEDRDDSVAAHDAWQKTLRFLHAAELTGPAS
ncbi:dienelactone hydrolase family protein [Salinactinospora qingdaonensis]|uniref:Dienelactone hydrolase family protein n=1 Tax=Salinactinospora qingdaonensis TaxID=702744 RepID=A0ABP7FK71_9ACTN